jgi:potassium/hydrogen antiporter
MTITIIIIFCTLLLLAYLFDLTSSKTKIPAVILLLLLGWSVRQFTDYLAVDLPNFSKMLPVMGTIGLILIVLEGSLELEMNHTKLKLIKRSFTMALVPMMVSAFLFAFIFQYYGEYTLQDSLASAIPLCVISSAIAIPSVRNLTSGQKEFVIYESSFSDIIGVLFFNFITLNNNFNTGSFGHFLLELLIVLIFSFIATIGLSLLLSKIEHHIKFVPIILLVILIYAISKIYHLPGLVFIMFFGLFIGNLDEFRHIKWLQRFHPEDLNKEVKKFKEINIEATFLVRALFFILFGFVMETSEILNTSTLQWSLFIVFIIFLFRAIQLKIIGLDLRPLLFVAPRGLITILLFLSIAPGHNISFVSKSLIIQVIIITTFIMMFGLITSSKNEKNTNNADPTHLSN